MSPKFVYLMRGLPSCGKSFTARQLAGVDGVILETDEYFYAQVGDDPTRFDYRDDLLANARAWNFARFQKAVDDGLSPIIVDRGNGRNLETKRYALYTVERGYRVELREPDSDWWGELRVLLKYKRYVDPQVFEKWANTLAAKSKQTHRVPSKTIRRWMAAWKHDLTVDEILCYEETNE
jgi:hypothetical protein